MHMLSRKDLNSAELETVKVSKIPTTVVAANGEVQKKKKRQCVSRDWIYSWQHCFSKRQSTFFYSENSAKITGIPDTGPTVRIHNSPKMADEWNATRRTTYRSLSQVYRQVPLLHLHLLLLHHRRKAWLPRSIQHQHEVRFWVRKYRETCRMDQQ